MKKIRKYICLIAAVGSLSFFSSCNDFLEREPLDGLTDNNYWASEANVKTYAWLFYNQFMGYGKATGTTAEFYFQSTSATVSANISDDITNNTYLPYQQNPTSSNTEWKELYEYIRRANLMLKRVPSVPMTDEAKKHWTGVAHFFRAYGYYKLVQRFGDVPYYDQFVDDPEKQGDLIFVKPTKRNDVMDKVRDDITKATEMLRESDGKGAVNRYIALALKARIGLYEGTYRKYHNAGDGKQYLEDARDAANTIIETGKYKIGTTPESYRMVYSSEDLGMNTEMILYKEYTLGIHANSIQSYTNTSTVVNGITKAAVENYVCVDGLPISQSDKYKGDRTLADLLTDRDVRLLAAVDSEGLSWGGKDKSISRSRKSTTGYVTNLFYNAESANITTTGQNTIDAPVFSYAEVLLNYAEARAELDEITQTDLNKTINLLRSRAGIATLTYESKDVVKASGVTINDPKRTSALETKTGIVSSIIWEIRRERRSELMTWTALRYYDLMRWAKGAYLDYTDNPDVALGAYLGTVPPGDKATLNPDGYIMPYPTQNRVFNPAKNYLNAIPTAQIELYKADGIEFPQNPGWSK